MYTPQHIMNLIEEDSPDVYDELRDAYFTEYWDGSAPPTDEELIEQLEKYEGDLYNAHWWYGRVVQMQELEESIDRLRSHLAFEMQTDWARSFPEKASAYRQAILYSIDMLTWKA